MSMPSHPVAVLRMPVNRVRCQTILATIVVISAAEKARNDSVRILPSAPRLKLSDTAEDSSGASTIVTTSYRPCVPHAGFPYCAPLLQHALLVVRMKSAGRLYRGGGKPGGGGWRDRRIGDGPLPGKPCHEVSRGLGRRKRDYALSAA